MRHYSSSTEQDMGVGRRQALCASVCVVCGWEKVPEPHLEHRDVVLSVDLVGGRVKPRALAHVLVQDAAALHVAQAELT